ncbi:MAG: DUF1559 domain-containing protein [Candidatus Omnitrophica bacterium]|nr:DUF1559 domain-containing protein [Candidatus Omnitrophota bacterium]
MLLPALARAREQARRGVCISNLKQIGLAIKMYAQDYDENYPVGNTSTVQYMYPTLAFSTLIGKAGRMGYLEDEKTFRCPSDARWGKAGSTLGNPSMNDPDNIYLHLESKCSYAYALGLSESTADDTVLAADKAGTIGSSWTRTALQDAVTGTVNHTAEGVNVLYKGGHTKWVPIGKFNDEVPNKNYPSTDVGYIKNP